MAVEIVHTITVTVLPLCDDFLELPFFICERSSLEELFLLDASPVVLATAVLAD